MTAENPIEGQVLILTAAKASVGGQRVPDLVAEGRRAAQVRADELRRRYERVHEDDVRTVFLAPEGFWAEVGDDLGWSKRERETVARANAEQLLRVGKREGRREEFETALEVREAVVIGA
ncbi:hypothetical protein [Halorussus caseinilyticus]|uniref:hypothetical protein n=1 Tax=Halorussus caseinilyticus TaxID=3034025 RepID=UPI0023E810CD|nr:hypothetical protein [Halorussus sp. DT72]